MKKRAPHGLDSRLRGNDGEGLNPMCPPAAGLSAQADGNDEHRSRPSPPYPARQRTTGLRLAPTSSMRATGIRCGASRTT